MVGGVAFWLDFLRSLGAEQQPHPDTYFRRVHFGQVNRSALGNLATTAAFCSHGPCHHDCKAATLLAVRTVLLILCAQIVSSRWIKLAASIAINCLVLNHILVMLGICVSLRPSHW